MEDLGRWMLPLILAGLVPTDAAGARELWIVAHRGASGLRPENTLPAFETALELCPYAVELDVRPTRGYEDLVVWHDERLTRRRCDGRLTIFDSTLEEVQRHVCDRATRRQDPGVTPLARTFAAARGLRAHTPVSLEQLYAFVAHVERQGRGCPEPVRINVEIKFSPEYDVAELAARVDRAIPPEMRRRTIVSSFEHRLLDHFRDVDVSYLSDRSSPLPPMPLRTFGWSPHVRNAGLTRRNVEELHRRGIKVIPYTANRPARIRELRRLGVDGVFTDYPDVDLSGD